MNRNINYLFIKLSVLFFLFFTGCNKNPIFKIPNSRNKLYGDVSLNNKIAVAFGEQISHDIVFGSSSKQNTVKDFLDLGCDPNFCKKFKEGWEYENPLMLFTSNSMYNSFSVENPTYPDIEVFSQLVSAGADINKYPYIWSSVFRHNNEQINTYNNYYLQGYDNEKQLDLNIQGYIVDSNRVLKLFLDAGADVNRKGNPKAFDAKLHKKLNDKKLDKLFNSKEATTPLYEAIKKGIVWESQVDLLLQYGATLEDSCLEAAKLSGDDLMIDKIQKLLNDKVGK